MQFQNISILSTQKELKFAEVERWGWGSVRLKDLKKCTSLILESVWGVVLGKKSFSGGLPIHILYVIELSSKIYECSLKHQGNQETLLNYVHDIQTDKNPLNQLPTGF